MRPVPSAALAFFWVIALGSGAAAALSGNSAEGKRLHDANCTGCHDTGMYTRKERKVQSVDALKQQVNNCSHMAGKRFSVIETENVVRYLNDNFYRFP